MSQLEAEKTDEVIITVTLPEPMATMVKHAAAQLDMTPEIFICEALREKYEALDVVIDWTPSAEFDAPTGSLELN